MAKLCCHCFIGLSLTALIWYIVCVIDYISFVHVCVCTFYKRFLLVITKGLFCLHRSTVIETWINNYTYSQCFVWEVITQPLLSNSINYIPLFYTNEIAYPWPRLNAVLTNVLTNVANGSPLCVNVNDQGNKFWCHFIKSSEQIHW